MIFRFAIIQTLIYILWQLGPKYDIVIVHKNANFYHIYIIGFVARLLDTLSSSTTKLHGSHLILLYE